MNYKVLWIAPYPYSESNSAPWVTELANKLSEVVELTVIAFNRKIRENEIVYRGKTKVHFIKLDSVIIDVLKLFRGNTSAFNRIKNINFEDFDLIHLHGTEHQYATAIKNIKTPKIISIQGLISQCYKWVSPFSYIGIRWRLLKKFEINEIKNHYNFFCRTHWDKENVLKLNTHANIFHCWEIMRDDFLKNCGRFESFDLIYAGGLNPMKGIVEVLRAFKSLNQIQNKFKLTICGVGKARKLKSLLIHYNLFDLRDSIIFKGFVNSKNLSGLYSQSFCLIHPSYIDNSPNSICEAQLCGLPVISSNVGGISSLISHKSDGILIRRKSVTDIVQAVLTLKSDKKLYSDIQINSRVLARNRHNVQSIVTKTLDAYCEILING